MEEKARADFTDLVTRTSNYHALQVVYTATPFTNTTQYSVYVYTYMCVFLVLIGSEKATARCYKCITAQQCGYWVSSKINDTTKRYSFLQ